MENQIVSSSCLGSPWGTGYQIHVQCEESGSWAELGDAEGDHRELLCPRGGGDSCHGASSMRRV